MAGRTDSPESKDINLSLDDDLERPMDVIISDKSSGDRLDTSIPNDFRSCSALCKEVIKSDIASFTSPITSFRRSNELYKKRTTLVTTLSCDSNVITFNILDFLKN